MNLFLFIAIGFTFFVFCLKYRNLPLYSLIALFPVLPAYFAYSVPKPLPLMTGYRIILYFFFIFEILDMVTNKNFESQNKLFNFMGQKIVKISLVALIIINIMFLLSNRNYSEVTNFIVVTVLEKILLLIFVVRRIKSKEVFDKCIDIIINTSLVIGLFGIFEFLTGFNVFSLIETYTNDLLLGTDTYIRLGQVRIASSFGHPITYSLYLGMALIICLYRLLKGRNIVSIVTTFVLLINFLLALSRGPMLVLIFSFILFIIMVEKRLRKRIIIAVVCSIVILGLFTLTTDNQLTHVLKKVPYTLLSLVDERYGTYIQDFGRNEKPYSYRLGLYKMLSVYVKNKPVFGYGYRALSSKSIVFYGTSESGKPVEYYSIDNNYLCELIASGFAGLSLFLFVNLSFMIVAFKNYFNGHARTNDNFNLYVIVIIIFYLLSLITVAAMEEKRIFWVILSLLCAYNNVVRKGDNSINE